MVLLTPQRTKNRRYLCACVSRFQIFADNQLENLSTRPLFRFLGRGLGTRLAKLFMQIYSVISPSWRAWIIVFLSLVPRLSQHKAMFTYLKQSQTSQCQTIPSQSINHPSPNLHLSFVNHNLLYIGIWRHPYLLVVQTNYEHSILLQMHAV